MPCHEVLITPSRFEGDLLEVEGEKCMETCGIRKLVSVSVQEPKAVTGSSTFFLFPLLEEFENIKDSFTFLNVFIYSRIKG